MRQTELHLSSKDRRLVSEVRAKGLRHVREVNRAHILAALDRRVPEAQIMEVLGVGRTAVWRTRKAYLEGGLKYALHDQQRPGKPRRYDTNVEAEVSALACSTPPAGAKRWTLDLLTQATQLRPGMEAISRQTIRRMLKKTASSPGAT
ncbi:MAG TPA: helix-turn-helix domain-containing protein [Burkholderiales bacterium]|nr:helix-turn-helix domain-containing protein [Burkholderiales bacterium]